MIEESLLRMILESLVTAPESQLRSDYRTKARWLLTVPETSDQDVHEFFSEVYALTNLDASSFVRELVNPSYTKGYS